MQPADQRGGPGLEFRFPGWATSVGGWQDLALKPTCEESERIQQDWLDDLDVLEEDEVRSDLQSFTFSELPAFND